MQDIQKAAYSQSSVIVWGQGEPVIMLHGSGAFDTAEVWRQQQPLAHEYQLLLMARPGYGERPARSYRDLEPDIQETCTLLETTGGAHLVGHSYGGAIAMLAAARSPELVRSLTVLEPAAFTAARGNAAVDALVAHITPLFQKGQQLSPEIFLHEFLFAFTGQQWPTEVLLPPQVRKGVEAWMAEVPPYEIEFPWKRLSATTFPKLVVSGNWNPAMEAIADALVQRLSACRAVCEGAGHLIPDTGETLNQLLRPFWQGERASRHSS